MNTLTPILSLLAGLVLLFAGRKVIWLAAALTAYLFSYNLLQNLFGNSLAGFIAALVIGLIFAWLALHFVKTVGFIIGALAGAVGLPVLLGLFGVTASWWILALIGAIVGILLVSIAFNWGLILMTAWLGANAVTGFVAHLAAAGAAASGVIFIVLLVVGILVQAGLSGRRR